MSNCCGEYSKEPVKKAEEKMPKSFIGRWLYKIGKEEIEKEKKSANGSGGCC